MSGAGSSDLQLRAYRKLADARYWRWHEQESRPEWKRLLDDLDSWSPARGALDQYARAVAQELLTTEVRRWISTYETVAQEKKVWTMLSRARLEEFRQDVEAALEAQIDAMFQCTFTSAQCLETEAHVRDGFTEVKAAVLASMAVAMKPLEAEGELPLLAPTGSEDAPAENGPAPLREDIGRTAFPNRASWLAKRLHERVWSGHDVERYGGPNHKTVHKILKAEKVRVDVLPRLVEGLNACSLELPLVVLADIPSS